MCPVVTLEQIVQQINQSGFWTATLLTKDGPAVRLCQQTNEGLGMPYECVTSEAAAISLADPSLAAVAATPSGGLQVREFLQAIAERDRAYWSR